MARYAHRRTGTGQPTRVLKYKTTNYRGNSERIDYVPAQEVYALMTSIRASPMTKYVLCKGFVTKWKLASKRDELKLKNVARRLQLLSRAQRAALRKRISPSLAAETNSLLIQFGYRVRVSHR